MKIKGRGFIVFALIIILAALALMLFFADSDNLAILIGSKGVSISIFYICVSLWRYCTKRGYIDTSNISEEV